MPLLGLLTRAEEAQVASTGKFPNTDQQRFEEMYKRVYAEVSAELESGMWNKTNTALSYRGCKRAIKTNALRMLQQSGVASKKPHEKGYKIERNMETLQEIFELVIGGWTDKEGNTRMYESLEQVLQLCPEQFQPLWEKTKLKTLRTLREQLKQSHPQLVQLKVLQKRPRDKAAVVVGGTYIPEHA